MSRTICQTCQRPPLVCYCSELVEVANQIKVIILQHPLEKKHPFNTGKIVNLCLKNSELIINAVLPANVLNRLLSLPSMLLYPSLSWLPTIPNGKINQENIQQLIVIDATWKKSKKILHLNPELQKLARLSLTDTTPSDYKIRKSNMIDGLSTVESVVNALQLLEPQTGAEALLKPFHRMIERQQATPKAT